MQPAAKLVLVKLLHTAVWVVMATAVFYAIAAPLLGPVGVAFYLAVAAIVAEALVLVLHHWKCPLTSIAERYTDERAPDFDIYLPRWLAEHNVRVFTWILIVGLVVNVIAWLVRRGGA